MDHGKGYTGIEYFRIVAALLVIAIHTSPLSSVSGTGDFILTRVAARTAVPFFFMTSGYFLISRYSRDAERLVRFVKHTMLVYGAAVILYLPVNLYNGSFRMENLAPNLVRDIVFDGTMYHLWYLPASIAGAAAAWYLVRKLDYQKAIVVTSVLWLVGLFGDSYYGFAEKIPVVSGVYSFLFQLFDHTRNGIFFAPVFFVLGGFLADYRRRDAYSRRTCLESSLWGFSVSFALMLGEALLLGMFHVQRHDSMYLFLPPCVYFLFRSLLYFRGRRPKYLKTLSLLVYLIHPMVIVAWRLLAKVTHLQGLLIGNSILFYLAVCLLSVGAGMAAVVLWEHKRLEGREAPAGMDRAYVEISLDNLEHNARVLQRAMPPQCHLMAVVKAEAYGHGAFEVAVHLDRIGVKSFAVATIDEGIRLRKYGIRGEILILGYTDVRRARELKKYDLIQTIPDFDYAEALDRQGTAIKAHIKIDTGMHRLGIPVRERGQVEKVFAMDNIYVCGIYTHLCCADSLSPNDVAFTQGQIRQFYKLLSSMKADGLRIPKIHIQSSYGLLNYPDLKCDYVRAGIALYGVLSSFGDKTLLDLDLRPVLSLKSKVTLIRIVEKGETVGYGRAFTAHRDSRIAIVPVGYADGIPRNLSCGQGCVMIGRYRVPVVGRICMDQLAVDVTDAVDIVVGDTVTLIGGEGDNILPAPAVACASGSISNELFSRIGGRLGRCCAGGREIADRRRSLY